MKTILPEKIKTVQEAESFLSELYKNGESYHPEDDAFDVAWILENPTAEECDQLNSLMDQIYKLENFDPCGFILSLNK